MQRVALFGTSGTMGFEAFRELWRRRSDYYLTVLLLPGERNLQRFRPYAKEAGLDWKPPARADGEPVIQDGEGLRIVWGDARNPATVQAVIGGADHVLNAMAVISPAADRQPELARQVNDRAVGHILEAIRSEPDGAERITYVHTGSVAQTGSRPPGVHVGRVGDPLNPSVFDTYALTKIAGERRVLESGLRSWISLRMSFIMPSDHRQLLGLSDPIMFHMPPDTRLEPVTDRDAGYAMVQCLGQPPGSGFWRRVYNVGGGPDMRYTALGYLSEIYAQFGLDWRECSDRNWYALRNFHLHYFEDSRVLNDYLGFWRDDRDSFREALQASMPAPFRLLRWLCRHAPGAKRLAEGAARRNLKRLAESHPDSPRYWYLNDDAERVNAFFGSRAAYEAIPGWSGDPPVNADPDHPWSRLDHGYDETKAVLDSEDLEQAAAFRGGAFLGPDFGGSPHERVQWQCAAGHRFTARPLTVLHAGHWCPTCTATWNGGIRAREDRFFAQVWYGDHSPEELHVYGEPGR